MPKEDITQTGTLKQIVFQRDGFLIGIFGKVNDEKRFAGQFNAVGNLLRPEIGMTYKLTGKWTDHPKFGRQLNFSFYEVVQPKSIDGIFRYLVRVTKWIGPKTAEALLDLYKEKTLDVLKESPKRVANEVTGITQERAKEIREKLLENEMIEAALVELEKLLAVPGARKSLPMDLIAKYGPDAPAKLKENPYILTNIKGIGFQTADMVALTIKYDRASVNRKAAACWHVLKENMSINGDIWMDRQAVETEMINLLRVKDVTPGITWLSEKGKVVEHDGKLTTIKADKDESYVASKICEILEAA